jgi:pimeloyl-ACP methyl ester carboxylesterase
MPRKKNKNKTARTASLSGFEQAWENLQAQRATQTEPPPMVSGRWLLAAGALAILAAGACAWGALCFLFWQGSWQLLYHPAGPVTRTPASVGLAFDPVGFATTGAGEQRLKGWWIPADAESTYARYTVLYLHGQDGNLSDALDALAELHGLGLNVLAFDYRGYGQSRFEHPSETRLREDAEWAIAYLTATRGVAAGEIVLDGSALGANLALEVAAAHPELAGVVIEEPAQEPMKAIFADPRAGLVPAKLLVRDRWELGEAAKQVRMPVLWMSFSGGRAAAVPKGLRIETEAPTMRVWLTDRDLKTGARAKALSRWLDDLPARH